MTCRWPSRRRPGSWPRPACRPPSTWSCCGPGPGSCWTRAAPGSYPRSLAAATQLIADRLAGEDPAAAELASVCAFLAPEPIPEDLFTGAASELPGELAARAADPLAWRQTLAHLARQSLARIDQRGLRDAPAHPGHPARPAHPRPGRRHPRMQPRRSWPPATPATRTIPSPGRGGRS